MKIYIISTCINGVLIPLCRSIVGYAATDWAVLLDGCDRVLRWFPGTERLADAADSGAAGSGDLRCGIKAVPH